MMSERKLIDFKGQEKEIQKFADEHCEGNFNFAVRVLIKRALINQ